MTRAREREHWCAHAHTEITAPLTRARMRVCRYEPTQLLVQFFRQLEVGIRELSLDLSGIGLTSVPIPILNLTHLTSLSLSNNSMSQLPLSLVELSKLVVLNVQDNLEIEWMSAEGIAATEQHVLVLQARLRDALPTCELDISHLRLRLIPGNAQEMDSITLLNAAHNELVALPLDLGDQATFAALTHLDVSYNRLRMLPASLGKILPLTHLDCSYNDLKLVPPEIVACSNLTLLHLAENPTLESPPPDVVRPEREREITCVCRALYLFVCGYIFMLVCVCVCVCV